MPRTPLSVNDVVEMKLLLRMPTVSGDVYMNTFHWKVTVIGATGNGYGELTAGFLAGTLYAALKAAAVDELQFNGFLVRRVIPAQVEAPYEQPIGETGGRADLVPLPTNLAAIVRRSTLQKGPKGNGRLYIMGAATVDLDGDLWAAGYRVLLDDIADAQDDLITNEGWTFQQVILNRSADGSVITGSAPVEETAFDNYVTGQIQRRIGRGM